MEPRQGASHAQCSTQVVAQVSNFYDALLVRIRCELEQLVTEREAMIAGNRNDSNGLKYSEADFRNLADRIAATAPDPHQFS